ncbi:MAG TPA: hypothetical protein ENG83_14500 [Nitrospirae bacterium]|nr:hypothetical protein [Nitrospirota bacterium]HDZ00749.1 hypothetical protein [Nitrospirota bacterium]
MILTTHKDIKPARAASKFLFSTVKLSLIEGILEYKPIKQFIDRVFDKKRLLPGRSIRTGFKKVAWQYFPLYNKFYSNSR